MITPQICLAKYGNPLKDKVGFEKKWMILHELPKEITTANKNIPSKVYVNKDFAPVLDNWLNALLESNVLSEIRTFDGCYNVRTMRGTNVPSIHSWGLAIDFNAKDNPLNMTTSQAKASGLKPFSDKFILISQRWVDSGALWKSRPDPMHFQLKS